MRVLPLLLCFSAIFASEQNPRILIIGSGASGIAAATKLLQNGITNIKILEAENRIGGRIHSAKFGEYVIDLGAQWVYGEMHNAVYDLASPLGFLSKSDGPGEPNATPFTTRFYESSSLELLDSVSNDLYQFIEESSRDKANLEGLKTGSYGEMMTKKIDEYFEAHKYISSYLREPLRRSIELILLSTQGAVDWNDVSANSSLSYNVSRKFLDRNWKEQGYNVILDIMMKKNPNPVEESPIMDKILLNKKVDKIKYEGDGPVRVMTTDGEEYVADHVICTVSLGVLKANYEKLFDVPLPEKNKNSIKNLGFGHVTKIFLYYDEPWWTDDNISMRPFLWLEADRKEIENDPERSWMLGISHAFQVEWKPKLLLLSMSGTYCEQMEQIPEEIFKNQTTKFVEKFLSNFYDVTPPKDIIRSHWNTNKNFRGTHSYRSLASDANEATAADLGSPIMKNNKPVVQFAGEATDPNNYATVQGAIVSGWREADRIIDVYKKD